MFWRAAFWARPAFFVVLAAGCVVACPLAVIDGVNSLRNQALVDEGRFCAGQSSPCLQVVTGELKELAGRREMGDEWSLRLSANGSGDDDFHVREGYSFALESVRARATAWVVDGDVVAVDTPEGYVPVWALGMRGLVRSLILAAGAVGGALGAIRYAWKKRAASGSWWAVRSPRVEPGDRWATLFLFPASAGFLPMYFGLPWWWLWAAVSAGTFLAACLWLPPWSVSRSWPPGLRSAGGPAPD